MNAVLSSHSNSDTLIMRRYTCHQKMDIKGLNINSGLQHSHLIVEGIKFERGLESSTGSAVKAHTDNGSKFPQITSWNIDLVSLQKSMMPNIRLQNGGKNGF